MDREYSGHRRMAAMGQRDPHMKMAPLHEEINTLGKHRPAVNTKDGGLPQTHVYSFGQYSTIYQGKWEDTTLGKVRRRRKPPKWEQSNRAGVTHDTHTPCTTGEVRR